MSENRNDTETDYASVKDPLNMHRTASNETTLFSEIPNITNVEKFIIAPREGKKQFQFSVINFMKSKHFFLFFLRVNLAIKLLKIFQ